MFDLGKSTTDWLGDLRQSGALEEADLEELESHLKDEIEQLMDKGLSEKEAFWVATSRVGNREELPEEYAKTNSRAVWRHRFLWMAIGVLAYLVFNYSIGLLSLAAAVAAVSSGIVSDPAAIVILSVQVLLACGSLGLVYLVLSRDRFELSSRLRKARQSRSRIIVFYVIPVVLIALFLPLSQFAVWLLAARRLSSETVGMAHYATEIGGVLFSILFAASLVSIAFVLSRPRKREPHLSLER